MVDVVNAALDVELIVGGADLEDDMVEVNSAVDVLNATAGVGLIVIKVDAIIVDVDVMVIEVARSTQSKYPL